MFIRLVTFVLVPILTLALAAPRVQAQTTESPVVSTEESDDDEKSQQILVGLLIVVVAILVILGIKSDRDWRSAKATPPPDPDPLTAGERWEVDYQPAAVGDRVEMELAGDRLDAGLGFRF
jgi:hypothetical protein